MATLDGQFVFGAAVQIVHAPRANAHQIAEFFGVSGLLSSFGGERGRTFMITGLFVGATDYDCVLAEADMRSFADGRTHLLVDNFTRVWPDVIFRGEIQNEPRGPVPGTGDLWYWGYKLVLEGLT